MQSQHNPRGLCTKTTAVISWLSEFFTWSRWWVGMQRECLLAGRSVFDSRQEQKFLSSPSRPHRSWVSRNSYPIGTECSFPGVRVAETWSRTFISTSHLTLLMQSTVPLLPTYGMVLRRTKNNSWDTVFKFQLDCVWFLLLWYSSKPLGQQSTCN